MTSAIQHARTFDDLLRIGEDGPYLFSQIFSTEGWRSRSRAKRTFKLLKKIDGSLREMLREGERVFFVTRGVAQPSVLEWYFLGAALYYMNQRAIVLTSQRVLLLQIDWRQRPKEMRNEIAYAAVASFENRWTGSTRVRFHSGGKVLLTGIPRADRKRLASIFGQLLGSMERAPARTELEHLCPHCYEAVPGQPKECPACAGGFKSSRTAGLLSLVYPGAGDLYLGHKGFALAEILGATLLWVGLTAASLAPDVGVLEAAILLALMAVFMHAIDAFTTYRIAKKGILPDSGGPHGWRFAAAAAVPVFAIGALAATLPSKARLRPDPGVVAGPELSDAHVAALRRARYVEPAETIVYFYSAGPTSILQDGSLLAEDRIVSYETGIGLDFHESARLDEVVDLEVEPRLAEDPLTQVYVVREDGQAFLLLLGTQGGGDERFIDEMTDRWRAARTATDGFWFDGGTGASAADPIIVRGTEGASELDDAAQWWMSVWNGEAGTDWEITRRSQDGDHAIKYLVDFPGTGSQPFVFQDGDR